MSYPIEQSEIDIKLEPSDADSNEGSPGKKVGKWTAEEDENLRLHVELFGEKHWKKIAEKIPGRNSIQCLHRWSKILKPGLAKGPWTDEEDEKLRKWVATEGINKWAQAAKYIKGRSGKQCRERWFNNLCPGVKKGPWTPEEDQLLFDQYQQHGSAWCKISKALPGRSENHVKNRFYSTLRKLSTDQKRDLAKSTKTTKSGQAPPGRVQARINNIYNDGGDSNMLYKLLYEKEVMDDFAGKASAARHKPEPVLNNNADTAGKQSKSKKGSKSAAKSMVEDFENGNTFQFEFETMDIKTQQNKNKSNKKDNKKKEKQNKSEMVKQEPIQHQFDTEDLFNTSHQQPINQMESFNQAPTQQQRLKQNNKKIIPEDQDEYIAALKRSQEEAHENEAQGYGHNIYFGNGQPPFEDSDFGEEDDYKSDDAFEKYLISLDRSIHRDILREDDSSESEYGPFDRLQNKILVFCQENLTNLTNAFIQKQEEQSHYFDEEEYHHHKDAEVDEDDAYYYENQSNAFGGRKKLKIDTNDFPKESPNFLNLRSPSVISEFKMVPITPYSPDITPEMFRFNDQVPAQFSTKSKDSFNRMMYYGSPRPGGYMFPQGSVERQQFQQQQQQQQHLQQYYQQQPPTPQQNHQHYQSHPLEEPKSMERPLPTPIRDLTVIEGGVENTFTAQNGYLDSIITMLQQLPKEKTPESEEKMRGLFGQLYQLENLLTNTRSELNKLETSLKMELPFSELKLHQDADDNGFNLSGINANSTASRTGLSDQDVRFSKRKERGF